MGLFRGLTSATVARGVWMRRESWRLGNAAMAAAFGLFCIAMGLEASVSGRATEGNAIGLVVIFALLAIVSGAFLIRILRAGLRIGPDGVVMRGVLGTHSFSASEVTGFAPGVRGSAVPLLSHNHGRPVGVFALGRTSLLRSSAGADAQRLQPLCGELNALLATTQAAESAPGIVPQSAARETPAGEYRSVRVIMVVVAGCFWIAVGVIAVLDPKPAVVGLMIGITVLETCFTFLILRLAKNNIDRESGAVKTP